MKHLKKQAHEQFKISKEQIETLEELSKCLWKLSEYCYDDKTGDWFNNEILAGKLGRCWGMSIDEMAAEIQFFVETEKYE